AVGNYGLRILSPRLLVLTFVTTKEPGPAPPTQWNFVGPDLANLPASSEFLVMANSEIIPVQQVGFKRRVIYAPLKQRDVRIGNYLYLQLASAIAEGEN